MTKCTVTSIKWLLRLCNLLLSISNCRLAKHTQVLEKHNDFAQNGILDGRFAFNGLPLAAVAQKTAGCVEE